MLYYVILGLLNISLLNVGIFFKKFIRKFYKLCPNSAEKDDYLV